MIRRTLPAHVALTLALMAWVLGSVAAFVHVIQVRHAVCADHGQVVELGEPTVEHATRGPVFAPASPDEHDHGCSLDSLPVLELIPAGVPLAGLAPLPAADDPPPEVSRTIRPLQAAPKTSPPTLS